MKKHLLLPVIALLSFTAHAELFNFSYEFSDKHQYQSTSLLPTNETWAFSTLETQKLITQWDVKKTEKDDLVYTPVHQIVEEGISITVRPVDIEQNTYAFFVQYFAEPTVTPFIDAVSGLNTSKVEQAVTSFNQTIVLIENTPVCNDEKFCITLISDYPDEG
jgi:hypothetical protein